MEPSVDQLMAVADFVQVSDAVTTLHDLCGLADTAIQGEKGELSPASYQGIFRCRGQSSCHVELAFWFVKRPVEGCRLGSL